MKSQRKKKMIFAATALLLLLPCFILPALGARIDVLFNKVNIIINGETVALSDEFYTLDNGAEVPLSIMYEGTNYLPLRKLGEFLGKDIDYDNTTKSVIVNDLVAESVTPPYVYYNKDTVMYEKFSSVPDFGAFAGVKLAGTNKTDASFNYLYLLGFDVFHCSKYLQLLSEAGFHQNVGFLNEEGSEVMVYTKDSLSLLVSTMNGHFSIIVFP